MPGRIVEIIIRTLRNRHAENLALEMLRKQRAMRDLSIRLRDAAVSAKSIKGDNPFARMAAREAAELERQLKRTETEVQRLKESLAALIQGCLQEIAPLRLYKESVEVHQRLSTLLEKSRGVNEGLRQMMRDSLQQTEAMIAILNDSYGPFPSHKELVQTVNQALMESVMEQLGGVEQTA